jgi:hypothetical protein
MALIRPRVASSTIVNALLLADVFDAKSKAILLKLP